jgi:two-component system sensor histidine kinase ChiS
MRILIADDNADNRQLLTDIVSSIGHEAITAYDGDETLRLAQAQLPDLVILDVTMPGMSGFEVCDKLKRMPATAHVPVLMLTALNAEDHKIQGLSLGADDYLTKPFNPRELIERIKSRLRQKEQTDTLHKSRTMIRETFQRYVAPAVVEQLLNAPDQVSLGGKLQEVTVLVADLEGFTSISERVDPQQLLTILNRYHTLLVGIVREYGGTVDKFLGDGLMALYNTPLVQPDHALWAVRTALAIRAALETFYADIAPEYRVAINFGVHSGMAVVGNVGAPDLMNFTAIGDTVNLAFRLQELTHGGRIIISEDTFLMIEGQVIMRQLGLVNVSGRATPVMTYEVTG